LNGRELHLFPVIITMMNDAMVTLFCLFRFVAIGDVCHYDQVVPMDGVWLWGQVQWLI